MATFSSNTTMSASNNTSGFRSVVAFFEGLFTAGGWVQTGDTGQASSATIATAGGTVTVTGYQVWRMNDALQSTAPVYVKIDFGSGTQTAGLGVGITIGTATNGSGSIVGTSAARALVSAAISYASVTPSYGSASSSRLCAILNYMTVSNNTLTYISIERSKDASGNDTGDGVFFLATSPNSLTNSYYMPMVGTMRTVQTGIVCPVPPSTTTLADGYGNIGTIPIMPFGLTGPLNPGINTLTYYSPDIATGQIITVSVKGVGHNYFSCMGASSPTFVGTSLSTNALLMLYE